MKRQAQAIVAVSAMLLTFALGASVAQADSPPAVSIDPATQVGVTGVHLSGTVDPEGGPSTTYWHFEVAPADEPENWIYVYGEEIGPPASEGSSPIVVQGNAEGLQPNREYVARLIAENQDFANRTETLAPRPSFTTGAATAPILAAGSASDVKYTTAHLAGTVDPDGGNVNPATGPLPIYVNFEVSTDGGANWGYVGSKELTGAEAESDDPLAVEVDATGLLPGKDHQFRLFAYYASYAGNVTSAPSATFQTQAVTKPTVVLNPISGITGDSVSLSGSVDPNGDDPAFNSSCFFEYMTDAEYQARDERQRVVVKATGGTYTLEHNGQITAPIAHNASAATVKAALEALSNVTPGSVTVTGGPGNLTGSSPYFVTFAGANPNELYAEASALTAPGKAQASTTTNGFFGQNEVQQISISATGGAFTVTFEGQATAPIAYDATPEAVQSALEALSNVGPGDIEVTGGYTLTFKGALGDSNQKQVTASAGTLTNAGQAEVQTLTPGHPLGFEGAQRRPCLRDEAPNEGESSETVVGDGVHKVKAALAEIEPKTLYHVRLRAENLGGAEAQASSFETAAPGPDVAAGTVGALSSDSARLTAYVNARNAATTVSFQYATDPGFSNPVTAPSGPGTTITGNGNKVAYADISGLAPGTDYYWRASATSSQGTDADTAPRAFSPYPVQVKETCPNEAIRERQGSTYLPDCRAYELVSNPNKFVPVGASLRVSADGERVIYSVTGGTDDTVRGNSGLVLSNRTQAGWTTSSPAPPRSRVEENRPPFATLASTPDFSRLLFSSSGVGLGDERYHLYSPESGSLSNVDAEKIYFVNFRASDDLSVIAARPNSVVPPGDPAPGGGLYNLASGSLQLISLLPSDVAPSCSLGWINIYENAGQENWISRDGRRVFFLTSTGDCSAPKQLYMREGTAPGRLAAGEGATSTLISAPALSGDEFQPHFLRAAPDGSWVLYMTAARLDPDDANDGNDVYHYTVGEGNECLTCAVADAQVSSVEASVDGARVYFTSPRPLAPGASTSERFGAGNLYVWRRSEPGQVEFVAPADLLVRSNSDIGVDTSDDGSVILFRSQEPRLDQLTATAGVDTQFYRYDDRARTLACVTCAVSEVATAPEGGSVASFRDAVEGESLPAALTADGRSLVMATASALVPEDINGRVDVYQWRDGVASLITDGAGDVENMARGITPDGRNLFFRSTARLLPATNEASFHVYVARIGGGFEQAPPPKPCGGEGCREAAQGAPPEPSAATPGFVGPGNQKAKPTSCAKGKAKKKGRCVKKKAKKRKGGAKSKNGGRR